MKRSRAEGGGGNYKIATKLTKYLAIMKGGVGWIVGVMTIIIVIL